jgi:hypothetical protein
VFHEHQREGEDAADIVQAVARIALRKIITCAVPDAEDGLGNVVGGGAVGKVFESFQGLVVS